MAAGKLFAGSYWRNQQTGYLGYVLSDRSSTTIRGIRAVRVNSGLDPRRGGQLGNRLADGKVGTLDDGGVDSATQFSLFEMRQIAMFATPQHVVFDYDSTLPALMIYLYLSFVSKSRLSPWCNSLGQHSQSRRYIHPHSNIWG